MGAGGYVMYVEPGKLREPTHMYQFGVTTHDSLPCCTYMRVGGSVRCCLKAELKHMHTKQAGLNSRTNRPTVSAKHSQYLGKLATARYLSFATSRLSLKHID